MNKLEEYRDKMADKYPYSYEGHSCEPHNHCHDCACTNDEEGFKEGFDAAIALDLPVKFYHYRVACQKKGFPRNENGSLMNVEELYKYWIDNVYTPDL